MRTARFFAAALAAAALVGCADREVDLAPALLGTSPLPPEPRIGEDARGRFREIFCAVLVADGAPDGTCDARLWRAPEEPPPAGRPVDLGPLDASWRLVLVSGYGSDCFAPWVRLLEDARARLAAIGVRVEEAPVSGLSGSEWNARIVAETVAGLALEPGERLVLLGYSKGAADMLQALVDHPEETARVDAAISLHGALGGAAMAANAPHLLDVLIEHAPGTACGPNDGGALEAMRPEDRRAWLSKNADRWRVPLLVLAGLADRDRISTALRAGWNSVATDGDLNDGQLTVAEQLAPGAVLLGHPRADHWAVGLPLDEAMPLLSRLVVDRNDFPRGALVEAAMRFLDERLARRSD